MSPLEIITDPRVGDVDAVRIALELEDSLGRESDHKMAELGPDTDVEVRLSDVPGTYDDFEDRVKNILEGIVSPERIRAEAFSSPDEWE